MTNILMSVIAMENRNVFTRVKTTGKPTGRRELRSLEQVIYELQICPYEKANILVDRNLFADTLEYLKDYREIGKVETAKGNRLIDLLREVRGEK